MDKHDFFRDSRYVSKSDLTHFGFGGYIFPTGAWENNLIMEISALYYFHEG